MEELFAVKFAYLIPLLPLLGAAVAGFLCTGRRKTLAHWPIWLGVGASAAISLSLLWSMLGLAHEEKASLFLVHDFYHWVTAGKFDVSVGFVFDPLTAVMLCVVTGIGFLITVFAAGYMKGEDGYSRFFAYLGLFIFMMTMLVLGNNFAMLYLGWEGVGLCSYLLIGYYYHKPSAREAAKKAFLVNRVGDFGFGLGIMLAFAAFGTISYFGSNGISGVLNFAAATNLTDIQINALKWLPFLLMLGAFGKSAQFPLYVWLPDAMEGPTPVSALIHAATMVTAGVYMIARCGTLFVANEAAMWTIAIVGAFTALLAATIALRQFDLKKVFAYSTISQLGYMFVGVGVLAPVAGVFHLVTHAFFKALLFLCSGVVMHAMSGELDLRKMSGLRRVLPWTRWLILIGCAALAGFPLLSGFFSKDEIIAAAWEHSWLLGALMFLTAFLTAYYTFRLYFRVFEGPLVIPAAPAQGHDSHNSHGHDSAGHEHQSHNHEPMLMILPLVLLAIGAIGAGYLNYPARAHDLGDFLGRSPSMQMAYQVAARHHEVNPKPFGQEDHRGLSTLEKQQEETLHSQMMILSAIISAAGIGLAYMMHLHNRSLAENLARKFPRITRLVENKYYVDEIYQAVVVESLRKLGRVFFAFDRLVIDGIVWTIGFVPQCGGLILKISSQRGELQGYAATMLLGVVIILIIMFAGMY